ncbi:MAG: MBOAT family O-acyltransferase [Opitutaceae bacterium]
MLFNSWPFLVLLCITFVLFYAPGTSRLQAQVLVAASFVFYAWENPWLLTLLCFSILANSLLSYALLAKGWRRHALVTVAAVVLNITLLSFFKYGSFFYASLFGHDARSSVSHLLGTLPLPIGISFYTFEGISLIVDIFRSRTQTCVIAKTSFPRHLLNTSLFVSFFPHLVSGPILKAKDFYPQIVRKRFCDIPWPRLYQDLVVGYFLKLVVADNLKDLTFYMEATNFSTQPGKHLASLLVGFSVQIFADFAGYSLIALGLARLFGYEMPVNFRFPYISSSLKEFWTRWHISLSQWLRNYLYIPLGGNRHGGYRTYFNLFLVMVLGGLWHGAAGSFALWGLYHGLGLAFERLLADRGVGVPDSLLFRPFRMLLVFIFVTMGWLLFKLTSLETVWAFMKTIIQNWSMPCRAEFLTNLVLFCLPVFLYHLWHLSNPRVSARFANAFRAVALGAMLFAILFNSGTTGRFIYFQF